MYLGAAPGALLTEADLVIALEADVPWIPSKEAPPPGARIVQIGEDPLYERYPMRNFPSDLTITATRPCWRRWSRRWPRPHRAACRRAARRLADALGAVAGALARRSRAGRAEREDHAAWLNHCLRAVLEPDTIVVNEYSFRQE